MALALTPVTALPTENVIQRAQDLHLSQSLRTDFVADKGVNGPTETQPLTGGVTFESILTHAVNETGAMEKVAGDKVQALASGVSDDMHGTMIASKEAEISLKLVGSIRNKLLDAFHEIWRTSV